MRSNEPIGGPRGCWYSARRRPDVRRRRPGDERRRRRHRRGECTLDNDCARAASASSGAASAARSTCSAARATPARPGRLYAQLRLQRGVPQRPGVLERLVHRLHHQQRLPGLDAGLQRVVLAARTASRARNARRGRRACPAAAAPVPPTATAARAPSASRACTAAPLRQRRLRGKRGVPPRTCSQCTADSRRRAGQLCINQACVTATAARSSTARLARCAWQPVRRVRQRRRLQRQRQAVSRRSSGLRCTPAPAASTPTGHWLERGHALRSRTPASRAAWRTRARRGRSATPPAAASSATASAT